MPYTASILSFDFTEGPVPGVSEMQFQNVADRARQIMAERTSEQVKSIVDLSDFLLDEYPFAREARWARAAAITEEEEPPTAPALTTSVEGMLAIMERISLDQYQDIPGLRWEEIFAALALILIAAGSLEDKNILAHHHDPDLELASRNVYVIPYLAESVEALCIAEGLIRQRSAPGRLSTHEVTDDTHPIRLQAKVGGIKRHAATNQLKRECIAYYQQHPELSMREAARRFYKELPSERQILTPTNAQRTLAQALTDFEKDRLPAHVLEGLPEQDK